MMNHFGMWTIQISHDSSNVECSHDLNKCDSKWQIKLIAQSENIRFLGFSFVMKMKRMLFDVCEHFSSTMYEQSTGISWADDRMSQWEGKLENKFYINVKVIVQDMSNLKCPMQLFFSLQFTTKIVNALFYRGVNIENIWRSTLCADCSHVLFVVWNVQSITVTNCVLSTINFESTSGDIIFFFDNK